MAHTITALIARADYLRAATTSLRAAHLVDLPQDFALLFLTRALVKNLNSTYPATTDQSYPALPTLTPAQIAFAKTISRTTPIAYIQTEYWAGEGSQSAVVWHHGQPILGPLTHDDEETPDTPLLDQPINQALRLLGVQRIPTQDEFDTLNLSHYRSNPENGQ